MTGEIKRNEKPPQILKIFLEELNAQLLTFNEILKNINNTDFFDTSYIKLSSVLRSLLSNTKIVQLSIIESLIFEFESFIDFLKINKKQLTNKDKELIVKISDIFNEIAKVHENELVAFINHNSANYQDFIDKFRALEQVNLGENKKQLTDSIKM